MSTRRVIGGIGLISPDAEENGKGVKFTLVPGSYNATTQYPQQIVIAEIIDGAIDIDLWANEEGVDASEYVCTLPSGEQFRFTLPASADPVQLSALRTLGVGSGTPQGESVLAVMEEQFATAFASVEADATEAIEGANAAAQTALDAAADADTARTTLTTDVNDALDTVADAIDASVAQTAAAEAATTDATDAADDARAALALVEGIAVMEVTTDTVKLYVLEGYGEFVDDSITIGGVVIPTVILETV